MEWSGGRVSGCCPRRRRGAPVSGEKDRKKCISEWKKRVRFANGERRESGGKCTSREFLASVSAVGGFDVRRLVLPAGQGAGR